MSRPTPEAISMLDPAWHTKINNNFEKIFNAPMPFLRLTAAGGGGVPPVNFTPIINGTKITESPAYTFTSSSANSDAYVYSTEVFSGSLYVSFTINALMANVRLSAGFGGTPDALGSSWTNDMVLYMSTNTTWDFYKLGTNVASGSGINDGDFIEFVYSGTDWEVFVNGGLIYSTTVTAGQDCYFSSSLSKVGAVISDVKVYLDAPAGAIGFDEDARLFKDCVGVYSGDLYVSDGAAWNRIPADVLENIVALDTGTATLQEIQDAYNALLADLQVKGWMA